MYYTVEATCPSDVQRGCRGEGEEEARCTVLEAALCPLDGQCGGRGGGEEEAHRVPGTGGPDQGHRSLRGVCPC